MAINRRSLLITGTATAVILGGGWAVSRDPKQARAPWREAEQGFDDPRLDVLAYAILAPNPHNMQPWQIRLDGDDAFTVFCDPTRLLPETDPPSRQITIGFGCFLELIRMAALEKGYQAQIDAFPDGEPYPTLDERPIAKVTLVKSQSAAKDPLFSTILNRRTNRQPFDLDRAPSQTDLDTIEAASVPGVIAGTTSDSIMVDRLRDLTVKAWETELANDATRHESVVVTRIGKREVNENPNGISVVGAPVEALAAIGGLTREKMNEVGSTAYEQTRQFYNAACETAMAYVWTVTATNTRRDQLEAGRAWVRMQMTANSLGVSFHPLSQPLQEFPAMAPHYQRAHEILASDGQTVQMLSRLGFAKSPKPAPRETLMSKLIEI